MKDETYVKLTAIGGLVVMVVGGLMAGIDGVILGAGIGAISTYLGIKKKTE